LRYNGNFLYIIFLSTRRYKPCYSTKACCGFKT